ncbi:hypothetical protein SUGI_0269430 [Cryptomeria japonica]|uniref:RING-H2 finger protein ATL67-like n=1 Tax=Cryptomeria japonica TaxID=3369 RepID=UPI002408E140|nr:RING-H2 finger protein ATL67-like [Cryptomeria japonica]GLJ16152.1 hypothetical protein SUGI_0269430 [Cryptomeria japonica]
MSTNSTMGDMSRVGLGYGIAIAVGILVLLSTVMLASYVCVRVHGRTQLAGGVAQREAVQRETGAAAAAGLDQATLDSYPLVTFSEKTSRGEELSCSICLSDYKESEVLRMLPECLHLFHVHCIDAWLRLHASCPMCRTSPLPTPIATPLSEFIPLARHPRIPSS